eukprot:17548_1
MVANSMELQIEQELTTFLELRCTENQLKNTTKKQCVAHLENQFQASMSEQKAYIKSILKQFIKNYLASTKNQNRTRKRKSSESTDPISSEPPLKRIKKSTPQINAVLNEKSMQIGECKDQEIIPKIKSNKVKSLAVIIAPLSPLTQPQPRAPSPLFESLKSIESVKEMSSLIQAENLISELNQKLTTNANDKRDIDYENIEYESLKNRLTKCEEECIKYKELAKQYASLLQPQVKECQSLKKQNEILNQNIETLKAKTLAQIDKLKNGLKNEGENVKEERFKCLRKDKYIQRMHNKFDFICKKYNIDKDCVVVEMKD